MDVAKRDASEVDENRAVVELAHRLRFFYYDLSRCCVVGGGENDTDDAETESGEKWSDHDVLGVFYSKVNFFGRFGRSGERPPWD